MARVNCRRHYAAPPRLASEPQWYDPAIEPTAKAAPLERQETGPAETTVPEDPSTPRAVAADVRQPSSVYQRLSGVAKPDLGPASRMRPGSVWDRLQVVPPQNVDTDRDSELRDPQGARRPILRAVLCCPAAVRQCSARCVRQIALSCFCRSQLLS